MELHSKWSKDRTRTDSGIESREGFEIEFKIGYETQSIEDSDTETESGMDSENPKRILGKNRERNLK